MAEYTTADAKRIAADIGADVFNGKLRVDWLRVQSDKRHGNIYAWDAVGAFLGQFRTHDKARAMGAHVTRIGITDHWFVWPVEEARQ